MSFKFVDGTGNVICQHGDVTGFRSKRRSTFSCPCPVHEDVSILCKDSYGDGWHGGFLQVSVNGGPAMRFCADFRSGKSQVETLPMPCNLKQVSAEEVSLEELA